MGRFLRNAKHEKFCRAIIFERQHPRDAYVTAGFELSRVNYKRLLRRRDVRIRIDELTQEREMSIRAAIMPIAEVLAELESHGIRQLGDFFEMRTANVLATRDLRTIRIEAILALIRALQEGSGMAMEGSVAPNPTQASHLEFSETPSA
jgi:hypothetical protein